MSKSFEILVYSPAGLGTPDLAVAASRAGALGVLDLVGTASEDCLPALQGLLEQTEGALGLRLGAEQQPLLPELLSRLGTRPLNLIVCGGAPALDALLPAIAGRADLRLLAEITAAEQLTGLPAGIDGLIARGHEAGGWVGEDGSFLLLQKLHGKTALPVYALGGIGEHSAAACRVAGAAGVVLDDLALLLPESPLPATLKTELARLNGAECRLYGELGGQSFRAYARPASPAIKTAEDLQRRLEAESLPEGTQAIAHLAGWQDSQRQLLPLGQGIGLAAAAAAAHGSLAALIAAVQRASLRQIEQAAAQGALAEGAPLALAHGCRYPIVQGPMTRVSDHAGFAAAVAQGGALPFLALALMRGPQLGSLLEATREQAQGRAWGVGLLGFIPEALRQEQCAAIWDCPPPFALIAGGRPDQAAEFESRGIATYIHAPAPALLTLYLEQGARRFVFEGRECGGHVGPLSSFALWGQMIDVLLAEVPAGAEKDIQVLFAGGIHDALSSAMVAAMAAPLVARGMRIGVLMGTAYLFTEEIVASGAVVPGFQEQALRCTRTVNLESGPGHATRCVATDFARDFQDSRRRLLREGKSVEEVRDALEDLNLGRLRIASKGLDRNRDGQLSPVTAEVQQREGMYMIGQVATLRDRSLSIAELHAAVSGESQQTLAAAIPARAARPQPQPSDIAIVGIGLVLPGADDAEQYWRNLLDQKSVIREVPESRWDWRLYFDENPKARDKIYSRWGGFLDEIRFDPTRFGIPPKSMKSIDPAQILTLEAASRALADAGLAQGGYDRETTSIVLGASGGSGDLGAQYALRAELPRYVESLTPEAWDRLPEWTEESFAGTLLNVAAGRVANRLDFGGINCTVDAACASSLAAIAMAVQELETGSSSLVLAGGFDTTQSAYAYTAFAKTSALSPQGKARTFDQAADGIVISEGVAMVALKRLADAERDGDRIYAVIKAVAGSSDGKALGLTAPRSEGQVRALDRAYAKAGFAPATLGLVEAHGTGTPVGDLAEAQTICKALSRSGAAPKSVALGSVKTLLGHTKAAAGTAGLVKVALSLYHRSLPPHYGVEQPIAPLADAAAPVYLLKEPRPWLASPAHPRRGAASAFGFGGTNFHVVLEEHPRSGGAAGASRWPAELFLFRAGDAEALAYELSQLQAQLGADSRVPLAELALSLALQAEARGRLPVSLAVVAADRAALARDLGLVLGHLKDGKPLPGSARLQGATPAEAPAIAFLFPGQGAQQLNMGREAALYFEEVRQALEFAERSLQRELPQGLVPLMMPPAAFDEASETAQARALTDTRVAQPAIGALSLGYLRLAERLGLRAVASAGHSYGEYSALMAAGVIAPDDFLRLSAARGAAMAAAASAGTPGGMAAVQARREQVVARLADYPGVVVANHNAPEQCVISGPKPALDAAVAALNEQGLRAMPLAVSGAFHTALVAPAKTALAAAILATPFRAARFPVYSNSSAQPYPSEPAAMQAQLDAHLLSSVEFVAEIEAMQAAGCQLFVELGPRGICANMARQTLVGRAGAQAVSLDGNGGGLRGLLLGLAEVFVAGADWRPSALYSGRGLKALSNAQRAALAQPLPSPAHLWMVSGGCARPIHDPLIRTGSQPALTLASREAARAALPTVAPASAAPAITPPVSAALPAANGTLSSEALLAYQQTMRQFLSLQERVMQQALGAGVSATASLPALPVGAGLPATSRLQPPPPAVEPAPAPVAGKSAPTPDAASVVAAPSVTVDAQALLLSLVAERTGYPPEMLGLDADLEADLGIDSIKRVEILGAFRKAHAGAASLPMEKLSKTKSLRAILAALPAISGAPAALSTAVAGEPAPTAGAATAPMATADAQALLLSLVAERTGYPPEMLGLDADLEADLGIDSIKRVEILGAFRKAHAGAASLPMEKLSKTKSLRAILAALPAISGAPAALSTAVAGEPAPKAGAATAPMATADAQALLLSLVAERTGYPPEMLGLDADLEADLGIDSIKRVEILGAFRKAHAGAASLPMEKLSKAKSLRLILAALPAASAAVVAGKPAPTVDTASMVATPAGAPATKVIGTSTNTAPPSGQPLPRYLIRSRPAPLDERSVALVGLALILGGGALANGLRDRLAARGLHAVTIDSLEPAALRAAIAAARQSHGPLRALIHLHGLNPGPPRLTAQAAEQQVLHLFHSLQEADGDLAAARVLVASRLGGSFGRDRAGTAAAVAGAGNGLLNCLRYEFPQAVLRAVDFGEQTESFIAERLVAELFADNHDPEAGYLGETRVRGLTQSAPLLAGTAARLEPGSDWLVLATGGARGITAELLEAMARPGMRLVLVGRSPLPGPEAPELAAHADAAALKSHLLRSALARGEQPRPADIDRALQQLLTEREIRANLARLAATGATLDYCACDARDETAFGALIERLYAQHGRIDAVLHAAGVIEDKRLADKRADSFARVLGTKLAPALTLRDKLRPESLKLLAFFTSVAGRYGNLGQGDYAAANESLNRLAWQLHRQWPATRVLAFNWGPWDAGMASEAVKTQLRARGMEPIPLAEGRRYFLDELRHGAHDAVEVVAGRGTWGLDALPPELEAAGPAIETASRWPLLPGPPALGEGGQVSLQLPFPAEPGLPPLASALELLAQFVCAAWPQWTLAELGDARLLRAPQPGQPVLLRARAASHSEPGVQAVSLELLDAGSRELLVRVGALLRPGSEALIAPLLDTSSLRDALERQPLRVARLQRGPGQPLLAALVEDIAWQAEDGGTRRRHAQAGGEQP
ncbi:SDR family NAD(P)-dependent oxidoreductase [Stagnimonas aquatica]|uniref:SDR family NAD(P)-dependent oxidoreductase n=1 Tax=Stagnimonas aquatica TaxID=2689987 RepID=A0A3N0V4T7_9GAMM|nr:type I polyketide synthase [Stagnimonas aquatica]ROH87810.1 SDR family NAD(P)-dependent oxidoreductase [Stagnimonas aquatica]